MSLDQAHRPLANESGGRAPGQARPAAPLAHASSITELMALAGNAAVVELLLGNASRVVQRQYAQLDPRLLPSPGSLWTPPAPVEDPLPRVRPKILAWLEPQRADLENRALFTNSGLSPDRGISMPELIAMVREHVPEALQLQPPQIAEIIRAWSHVQIPEHKLVGGTVADSEVAAAISNVLGKPGTIRVERPSRGWMEVTAGGIEIGRDDRAPVDVTGTVGWDGSIGASLSVHNVKGSFQISPNRTWQVQIAIPAGATVPVVNQMSNVFNTANHAARTVAGQVDAAGGRVNAVSVDVLRDGLGPVKDSIDTLSSITDKENPVSFGVTASGDFGGGIAVEATVTIRW